MPVWGHFSSIGLSDADNEWLSLFVGVAGNDGYVTPHYERGPVQVAGTDDFVRGRRRGLLCLVRHRECNKRHSNSQCRKNGQHPNFHFSRLRRKVERTYYTAPAETSRPSRAA